MLFALWLSLAQVLASPIDFLPNEIMVKIFNRIPQHSWHSLLTTCRLWQNCAVTSIQDSHEVLITDGEQAKSFMKSPWTSHIRRLSTISSDQGVNPSFEEQQGRLAKLLDHCSQLESLKIYIQPGYEERILKAIGGLHSLSHLTLHTNCAPHETLLNYNAHMAALTEALKNLPKLHSLHFMGPHAQLRPEFIATLHHLASLRELKLGISGLHRSAFYTPSSAWGHILEHSSGSVALTSLTFENSNRVQFFANHFQNLTTLRTRVMLKQLPYFMQNTAQTSFNHLKHLCLTVDDEDHIAFDFRPEYEELDALGYYQGTLDLRLNIGWGDTFAGRIQKLSALPNLTSLSITLTVEPAFRTQWERMTPTLLTLTNLKKLRLQGGDLSLGAVRDLGGMKLQSLKLGVHIPSPNAPEILDRLGTVPFLKQLHFRSPSFRHTQPIAMLENGFAAGGFSALDHLDMGSIEDVTLTNSPSIDGTDQRPRLQFLEALPSLRKLSLKISHLQNLTHTQVKLPQIQYLKVASPSGVGVTPNYINLLYSFPQLEYLHLGEKTLSRQEVALSALAMRELFNPGALPAPPLQEQIEDGNFNDDSTSDSSSTMESIETPPAKRRKME